MSETARPLRIGVVGLITIGGSGAGAAGGVEKLIEEVSWRLAARGHDVTVYGRRKYNPEGRTDFRGVRIRNLPAIYTKHLEAITHSFLSLIVAIRECEIIQIHSMGPALLAFIPRLFGRKTVCTLHGLDWQRDKWGGLAKRVLRLGEWCALHFPNTTTVVSQALQRYCTEHYRKSVAYVPNGVPEIAERPLDNLQRFGLKPDRYLLYLGRIVPEKGLHYLIEAYKSVETEMPLFVVGDARHAGSYYDHVRQLADGDERIIFAGPLYGDEKEEAYSNAYLFCLPSDVEGLPIVLLEAMGAGRCCLTSDIPEVREMLTLTEAEPQEAAASAGYAGRVFRKGDVDDLATALRDLLANPEAVDQLGARARDHARTVYNWDRVAGDYEAVYYDTLGIASPPAQDS